MSRMTGGCATSWSTTAPGQCPGAVRGWALENRCPHQGGPLGEGSIEKGLLRCPWHGYDYDPLTDKPPAGFSDGVPAYQVDERADGVYVQLPPLRTEVRTVTDVIGGDTGRARGEPGVRHGRAFESRLRRCAAPGGATRRADLYRDPARGRSGIRGKRLGKLTGRPAACFAIAGPRLPHPQPYRHQAGLAGIAALSRMPVVTWPPSPQACPTVTGTLRAAKIPRG